MKKATIVCVLLLVTAGFGHKMLAQDQPSDQQPAKAQEPAAPEHFFHLDFVVEELNAEGKVVNSRSYSTAISTNRERMSIRSDSRVPIPTGPVPLPADEKNLVSTPFEYEHIGANFDAGGAHVVDGQLALALTADLSSVAEASDQLLHHPVMRQNKWQSAVLIPIGKQTVVFTSDSPDSKGSTRVLVTATAIQ